MAAAVGGAYIKHDVTVEADWVAAVAFARESFGGLDILVNNAGIFWMKPIGETTLEDFRRMQQVNVEGVFLGLKHAIPAIAERGAAVGRRRLDRQSVVGGRSGRSGRRAGLQRLQGRGAADDQGCGAGMRARRAEGPRQLGASGDHRHADDEYAAAAAMPNGPAKAPTA